MCHFVFSKLLNPIKIPLIKSLELPARLGGGIWRVDPGPSRCVSFLRHKPAELQAHNPESGLYPQVSSQGRRHCLGEIQAARLAGWCARALKSTV